MNGNTLKSNSAMFAFIFNMGHLSSEGRFLLNVGCYRDGKPIEKILRGVHRVTLSFSM